MFSNFSVCELSVRSWLTNNRKQNFSRFGLVVLFWPHVWSGVFANFRKMKYDNSIHFLMNSTFVLRWQQQNLVSVSSWSHIGFVDPDVPKTATTSINVKKWTFSCWHTGWGGNFGCDKAISPVISVETSKKAMMVGKRMAIIVF